MRYEYWQHTSGEKYLIRITDANVITGVCGPMNQADVPIANRGNFDYDVQPRYRVWLQAHLSEYHSIGSSTPAL